LHHFDEHMNATTGVRHHWLEMPINALCVTAPLMILFRPPIITVPLASLLAIAMGYFIHLNVSIDTAEIAYFGTYPTIGFPPRR
jgi:sterol desaturase/sphingolipid hydroxylase (fatty acid hydroxylase superfamily)